MTAFVLEWRSQAWLPRPAAGPLQPRWRRGTALRVRRSCRGVALAPGCCEAPHVMLTRSRV